MHLSSRDVPPGICRDGGSASRDAQVVQALPGQFGLLDQATRARPPEAAKATTARLGDGQPETSDPTLAYRCSTCFMRSWRKPSALSTITRSSSFKPTAFHCASRTAV